MRTKYTYNEKRKEWYTLVYDGTLTPSGAKHRKRISSKKSSADLEKKVIAFKLSLSNEPVQISGITFGEYAAKWFEIYKDTKELNTKKMYACCIHYLEPLNDIRLTDIRHSHIQQVININQEHPKTCKNIKLTFNQIIKSAVRDRFLPHTAIEELTTDISLPKYQKPLKRALSPLEIKAMMEADLSPMKRAYVTIIYYCGLRRGEALALTPEDFDFINHTVSISKVVVFDGNSPIIKPYPKSDNGIRLVPLPEPSESILKPYVDNCTDYLFKGQNKALMTDTAYRRMWQSIITEMNIACGYNPQQKKNRLDKPIQGLTAHVFRHNYCTRLCYQIPTISTKKIAQLMGDTEKVVLNIYSHILEEEEDVQGALKKAFLVTN